ncbi:MAG TPA: carboxymuconolactone decarboxylase family protein [Solirubrobacteraceae bacterium]|nr:carboxymuconolactone decarboxylase family protein [Solirubrobacteraceae bacterium]
MPATNQIQPPRIAPLDPPYSPDVEEMLRKWMPPDSGLEPLALFRTLVVHGSLAARMRPLGAGILGHGLLEPRDRELMIDRTCARCGAEYEWGVHARFFGPGVGFSDDQLAATVTGAPDEPVWSERDSTVIRLADELHDTAEVSDETYGELERHFTAEQILELVVTAGWYHTISFVIAAARVPLEPWAPRFPR